MPSFRSAQRFVYGRLNTVAEPIARSRLSGPFVVGVGLTLLETTGRRSGMARTRPVVGVRCGSRMLAATTRPSSDWIANLRATPDAALWIDGERTPASADVTALPVGSLAVLRLS